MLNRIEISNTPFDPFWANFTKHPFEKEFLTGNDDDDDKCFYLSRSGCEICIGIGANEDSYLFLDEALLIHSALGKAINDLRSVLSDQTLYFKERKEQEISKEIERLPLAIVQLLQDANNISTTMQAIKAFNASNQNGMAADVAKKVREQIDSLQESLKKIETTLMFADQKSSES